MFIWTQPIDRRAPACLVLAFIAAAREKCKAAQDGSASKFSLAKIFPWFIPWFLVASAVRTAGLIPLAIQPSIHFAAEFLIIVALTAIGLSSNLRRMASSGIKSIPPGLSVWVAVGSWLAPLSWAALKI